MFLLKGIFGNAKNDFLLKPISQSSAYLRWPDNSLYFAMKRLTLILLSCLLCTGAMAQKTYNSSGRAGGYKQPKQKGFDPSKVIFGGGIGLSFGTVTYLAISPVIGYRVLPNLAVGVQLSYQYYRQRDYFGKDLPYSSSLFAPAIWTRLKVYKSFFVQAQPELDFQSQSVYAYDNDPNSPTVNQVIRFKDRVTTPALLIGAGIAQRVTDNSSVVFMVLYDVIQDQYSPYKGRVDFRIGFNVGW